MLQGEEKDLSNVLLVLGITKNLISVGQIMEKVYEVKFDKDGYYVKNDKGKVVVHGEKNGRLFKLKMNATHNANFSSHFSSSSLILWHKRLGHISHQSIMHLKKEGLVEGLPTFQVNEEPNLCPSCQLGKQQRRRFNKSTYRTRQPLELIHSDVWGPSQTTSMGGAHYILTFVDDMSRKVWVYFLKNKSEVFSYFKQFKAIVEKECGRFIKTLRSNQGGEFKSKEFEEFCWDQGIWRQYTCAYTPQQNGVAERKNRVIVEHARAMLSEGNLPKLYWAEAVNTSIHLMNMSPTEALTKLTPEEAYSGIMPNVSTLKVIECVAYMHILDEKRKKLDVKSEKCVFTGYDMYSKGYRLVNPDIKKIHISRDVIFDESDRWFKNTSSSYEEVSLVGENTTSQHQNSVMESTISHESAQDIAQEDASLQSINSATCPNSHIHEEDSTLKLRRSTRNNMESFGTPDIVLKEDFGRDKDLKTLLKTVQPEPFIGEDSDNASKLEEWIISMEDYFDLAEYNFVAKGIMGRAKIKGPAKIWWKLNYKSRGVLEITQSWEELHLRLRERYSPPNYLTTKMNEFLACVWRGRTIDTYYEDFIKLSMHALLITEEQKLSRFILGLEGKLADEVEALRPTSLADALIWAKPKFSSFLKSNNQQGEQKREQFYHFESSHRPHKFQNMAKRMNRSEVQHVRVNALPITQGRSPMHCFECGQERHKRMHCPQMRHNRGFQYQN
ncbi:hypothetical protein L7F22_058342 [Adiantum nelumboides]|nr:hypothetical protein [Adiantum nelumboides]